MLSSGRADIFKRGKQLRQRVQRQHVVHHLVARLVRIPACQEGGSLPSQDMEREQLSQLGHTLDSRHFLKGREASAPESLLALKHGSTHACKHVLTISKLERWNVGQNRKLSLERMGACKDVCILEFKVKL